LTQSRESSKPRFDYRGPHGRSHHGRWCVVPRHSAQRSWSCVPNGRHPRSGPRAGAVLWDAYEALAASFVRVGNTRIRFRIANTDVDLLPFGDVEDPQGVVDPPARDQPLSVWALEEIFVDSLPLPLTSTLAIRIPTVAGFAAAKLGAWLDRSEWHETRDAADLALILHWYAESPAVQDQLYDTPAGNETLLAEGSDVPLAAAHLLGNDVVAVIGHQRQAELLSRWPGNRDLLVRELTLRGGPAWPPDPSRRLDLIDALTRGLSG
jgi:predicted nucleotidyltransferase